MAKAEQVKKQVMTKKITDTILIVISSFKMMCHLKKRVAGEIR